MNDLIYRKIIHALYHTNSHLWLKHALFLLIPPHTQFYLELLHWPTHPCPQRPNSSKRGGENWICKFSWLTFNCHSWELKRKARWRPQQRLVVHSGWPRKSSSHDIESLHSPGENVFLRGMGALVLSLPVLLFSQMHPPKELSSTVEVAVEYTEPKRWELIESLSPSETLPMNDLIW